MKCAWCSTKSKKRGRGVLVKGRWRRVCDYICEKLISNHSKVTKLDRPRFGARDEAEWASLATQGSPSPALDDERDVQTGAYRRLSKRAQKSTDEN